MICKFLLVFFLLSVGCATIEIDRVEWQGLVYTKCSESPEVLNDAVEGMKRQGFVETGTMFFKKIQWEGKTYNCFCKSMYLLEE